MDAQTFAEMLEDLLSDLPEDAILEGMVKRTSSFENEGMLTRNDGLVVRLRNGDQFQVTVVQSDHGAENA